VSDARQYGSVPPDDPHLPAQDVDYPVDPPSPAWVPVPGNAGPQDTSATSAPTSPAPREAPAAGEAPTDRAPTDHTPTDRTPTDRAPTDDAPSGSTPAGSPAARTPADPPPSPGMDDRERPLAPKVVTAWRIGSVVSLILPTLVLSTLGFVFLGGWGWAVLGALAALALFLTVWYAPARYARWRWQLTDLAVELRYGVVVRQQETVPYFRIQQIDIVQGPLDRILDLATLQVTTASASGSAALPGIANDDAPTVRAELLARAAAAVADHPGDLRDAV
jgi:uncharacterized protein